MTQSGFLLFSGYNMRAVVALCRLFTQSDHPFFIVASGSDDPIFETSYAPHVVHQRESKKLSLTEIGAVVEKVLARGDVTELLYCPTSEFLNQFLLDHEGGWPEGLAWPGVGVELYGLVTSKWRLGRLFQERDIAPMPALVDVSAAEPPCFPFVLKPKQNVAQGRTLYPLFVTSSEQWRHLRAELDLSLYFAQQYLDGQSHYLCFYMGQTGEVEGYGQVNLVQQPGGKSIVFARPAALADYPLADRVIELLRGLQYRGPIMIEFMEMAGRYYFIEANPRFWGPLQLAFSANPGFFSLYLKDVTGQDITVVKDRRRYYAWHYGYLSSGNQCRIYPQAASHLASDELSRLLWENDVFQQADSYRLLARAL